MGLISLLLVAAKILLVAAKILLVAMPRRNQWKKNSVGRDKNSVGHDKIAGAPLRHFIAWYARKILYHATRRRMVQNFSYEPWNNLNKKPPVIYAS
jgi:hypothetical protein